MPWAVTLRGDTRGSVLRVAGRSKQKGAVATHHENEVFMKRYKLFISYSPAGDSKVAMATLTKKGRPIRKRGGAADIRRDMGYTRLERRASLDTVMSAVGIQLQLQAPDGNDAIR